MSLFCVWKTLFVFFSLGVLLGGISDPTWAAADMFMKIEGGIEGESTDSKHDKWIEIESWSWGLSNTGSFNAGGGKRSVQEFSVVKKLDKSSPKLAMACASGQIIPTVTLELVVLPEDPAIPDATTRYMKYIMRDVLISSVRPGGTVGDVLPLEEVSLNFMIIELIYNRELPSGEPLDQEIAIVSNPDREANPAK